MSDPYVPQPICTVCGDKYVYSKGTDFSLVSLECPPTRKERDEVFGYFLNLCRDCYDNLVNKLEDTINEFIKKDNDLTEEEHQLPVRNVHYHEEIE